MLEEIKEKQNELKIFDVDAQQILPEEAELLVRCRSYPMRCSYDRRWVKPFSYAPVVIAAIAAAVIAVMNDKDMFFPAVLIVNALWIGIAVKEGQFEAMKKLTQYFQDYDGEFYRVIFTQGASVAPETSRHGRLSRRYTVYSTTVKTGVEAEICRKLRKPTLRFITCRDSSAE